MKTEELIAQAEMSPCVGVCKVDEESGWCYGCGRTLAEISEWQQFSAQERETLELSLPDRVEQLIERRRQARGTQRGARRRRS